VTLSVLCNLDVEGYHSDRGLTPTLFGPKEQTPHLVSASSRLFENKSYERNILKQAYDETNISLTTQRYVCYFFHQVVKVFW
jgi:hypothetical protein